MITKSFFNVDPSGGHSDILKLLINSESFRSLIEILPTPSKPLIFLLLEGAREGGKAGLPTPTLSSTDLTFRARDRY